MDLSNCTLVELRQMAKETGIKNVTKLRKDELIELLEAENEVEPPTTTTETLSTQEYNMARFQIDENAKNDADLTYKLTNEDDFIDNYNCDGCVTYLDSEPDDFLGPIKANDPRYRSIN